MIWNIPALISFHIVISRIKKYLNNINKRIVHIISDYKKHSKKIKIQAAREK